MKNSSFNDFATPPAGYGTVPFYWWLGDTLTKERLSYQLDLLSDRHISGLQVNYAHSDVGGHSWGLTYEGDPAIFSDEWWELFSWFVGEANRRGMSVSLSDYTLFAPGQGYFTDKVLARHPEMAGQRLRCHRQPVTSGECVNFALPAEPLCAAIDSDDETVPAEYSFTDGSLTVTAEKNGELFVVYAERVPYSYDPMHPRAGDEIIDVFFGEFERRLGLELAHGLNFFFSDELEFGIGGDLWDDFFADEFIARKGYDIRPHLCDIFREGDSTVKTRLDYRDVIVAVEEKNYFSKVYNWHEERGMIYGCDHGGRGYNVVEFGDYMRTQKYNQGPGCDQPRLSSDIIKNKVASSISHLHRRPRVWLEGFYGSGWGTSTEGLTDAIARNYVMGQNLLSLHGLYYSTHGGWWEWAPPCNCFRMPYWDHMESLLGAIERLSYTMTRGTHSCDIGIIYPVDAVDGGIGGDLSVSTAFGLADRLYSRGIDLDFLDRESILTAGTGDGTLDISGESYSFIVIPEMRTMRSDVLEKLLAASQNGVRIVTVGELPKHSDGDISEARLRLASLCDKVSGVGEALELLLSSSRRDVIPETKDKFYINHRKFDGCDLYMTYGIPRGERCFFRGRGRAVLLNVRDGRRYLIENSEQTDNGLMIKMPVESTEFQLILIGDDIEYDDILREHTVTGVLPLGDVWDFELIPTMNNKFGDFELPETDEILPCEIKELSCDGDRVRVTYGEYFVTKEAFESEDEYESALASADNGDTDGFMPYVFSMRFGVPDAPGHQGYHGLKGNVTDDFLTIGKKVETQTSENFVSYDHGFGKVFCTNIICNEPVTARILTGDIVPDALFINGVSVDSDTIPLKRGRNRVVAGYKSCGRTHLIFAKSEIGKSSLPLSMRWWQNDAVLPLSVTGGCAPQTFSFTSPPALKELTIPCEGVVTDVCVNGKKASVIESRGQYTASVAEDSALPCEVSITVECARGQRGGAAFSGPIRAKCGKGRLPAGDWSHIDGLKFYSGGAVYSQTVHVDKEISTKHAALSVERIVSTAEAFVNGQSLGVRFAPPWRWDIGCALREGENEIRLEVYNTIGNHYEYTPTRFKSGTESGIIGKAIIEYSERGSL